MTSLAVGRSGPGTPLGVVRLSSPCAWPVSQACGLSQAAGGCSVPTLLSVLVLVLGLGLCRLPRRSCGTGGAGVHHRATRAACRGAGGREALGFDQGTTESPRCEHSLGSHEELTGRYLGTHARGSHGEVTGKSQGRHWGVSGNLLTAFHVACHRGADCTSVLPAAPRLSAGDRLGGLADVCVKALHDPLARNKSFDAELAARFTAQGLTLNGGESKAVAVPRRLWSRSGLQAAKCQCWVIVK